MADKKTPLKKIAKALRRNGYDAEYQPAGETNRIGRLQVKLADDYRDRSQLLNLSLASEAQAVRDQASPDSEQRADPYAEVDFLQFYIELPFTPSVAVMPALAQRLHAINGQLPLVGFGLKEGAVYFRYLMMFPAKKIQQRLVYEAVTVIEFILQRFLADIEETAAVEG